MKILIVMSSGFDSYGPSRHLYSALIEDLLADGHTVHLIESHSTGTDEDAPENLLSYNTFSYETISYPQVPKRAFAKRYLNGVKYCYRCIPALKNQIDVDIVLLQSTPCAPFAVSIVKRHVKAPVVWNIQDMFPGASIANGAMTKKWMKRFFYRFHKIAYRKADHITVISDDMKQKVIEQGVTADRLTVIPDWYDDTSVREIPWSENLFVQKYNMSKDVFYVQYAGTMGFNFDYRMVLQVAELLKDQKDILFQMIGFGSQKEVFEKSAIENGLSNIVFLPLEHQNMVAHVYSACSVCFIPLPKGVIGNSVPSKAGLLMACKRAIVTTSDQGSQYNEMINSNKMGFAFDTDSPERVAEAILFLKDNAMVCREYGINGYKFGSVLFSRSTNTKKYIDLFQKIVQKGEVHV